MQRRMLDLPRLLAAMTLLMASAASAASAAGAAETAGAAGGTAASKVAGITAGNSVNADTGNAVASSAGNDAGSYVGSDAGNYAGIHAGNDAGNALVNATGNSAEGSKAGPLQAIARLDLPRYMGRWHEIARFPNWFQKKCVAAATADYALRPDGTVQVVNRCRTADGAVSVAEAEGRRVGPEGSARLKVRFAPAWLSFLPFVWGKYWVVDLDPDYRLVAVGEPGRDYLWVLSRTPVMARADYEALRARLAAKGFDVTKLQVTGTIE